MTHTYPAVVNFAAAPGSVELRSVSAPTSGADEVLVEVAYVGVCGSDLHRWLGTASMAVTEPIILGHEFSGRIAAMGPGVTGFRVGERVVSETAAVVDANNPLTRRGLYNLDPSRRGFGYGVNGAMTRFVRVPQRCLHRIPDNLSLRTAALTEPCCVAYNAVANHSQIRNGDQVVVLGPGPVGILCAALAQRQGGIVTLIGLPADAERLEVARRAYGVSIVSNAPTAVKTEGDGLGADVVIDAAGVSKTLELAMALVRPAGWITKVGWGPEPASFSLDPLVQKNITLQGCYSHNWPVWDRVLQLLASRRLEVDALIGGVWDLSQWRAAFTAMHEGRVVKSLLRTGFASD